MEIREMYYFIKVMQEKNITSAAKHLHISQPALSKAMKKIESSFNEPLFERTETGIIPTNRALVLYEKVIAILQHYEEMDMFMQGKNNQLRGRLRIGLPPVIGTAVFVPIITSFKKNFPFIELELIESGAKLVEQQLEKYQLDIGVVIAPVDHRFNFIPLVTEEVVALIPLTHPLAKEQTVSIEQFIKEDFLLLNQSFSLHHQIVERCQQAGFRPNITLESSQWDFIMKMIQHEQGITILPEPIIRDSLQMNENIVKKSFSPKFDWTVGFISRSQHQISPLASRFIEHALTCADITKSYAPYN